MRPFQKCSAINRSLKNNDQKDIPLDGRDWAKARDAFIVRRHGRAGDMSFVIYSYLLATDCDQGRAEARVHCALLPNCECSGAQNDEEKAGGASARQLFVEGKACEQHRYDNR